MLGPGRSLRILLVDDEELVRLGTADMLADLGHDVTDVGLGARAISLLRATHFDLLVTDYLMPGMNGLEVAREAQQAQPDLPILLITGFADLADGAGTGINRLAKPFRQRDLARLIGELTHDAPALTTEQG